MTKERLKVLLFNSIICLLDERNLTIEQGFDELKEELGITEEEYNTIMK